MNDTNFLKTLKKAFEIYLQTGARSNKKLEVLHGAISKDLMERLDDTKYSIASLGYGKGKEKKINGRYVEKAVDITVMEGKQPIAGIAVKFVMSNYSQNTNNYFEGMLGETANIRSAKIPYFQIFIVPDYMPYFKKDREISRWEELNEDKMKKYIKLSNDDIDSFLHTPNKTLLFVINIDRDKNIELKNEAEYKNYYEKTPFEIKKSSLSFDFGKSIIFNDYDTFMQKVAYAIKSL